jgi:group I intron endonuclease
MKSGIYKITNSVNGKFYIGSSADIDYRWNDHKQYLNGGYHINPKLQNAWNFYGGDKFTFEIVEETSSEKSVLLDREQHYLDLFKPYMRDIGYNICPKAAGGDNITHNPNRDAFVEKMRTVCLGENNPMYGRKHSEKSKQLQKDKAKGRFSLEWFIEKYGSVEGTKNFDERRIMLKNRKINYSRPNILKGKTFGPPSEENKQKIRDSKKRLKITKPFLLEDIKSDKFTMIQLCEKYQLSLFTIKYYKRKLKNEQLS